MNESTPTETFVIKDLETLRTIADSLRSQILESLVLQPLTVKQVAEKLGLSPKKLYYHVRLLESHGLIQVVETRVVSNMIEKVYRATASSLVVDPSLCCFGTAEGPLDVGGVSTALIDLTREDLVRSLEARAVQLGEGARKRPRRMILYRELSRIDEARAHVFQARLSALLREFEEADTERVSADEFVDAASRGGASREDSVQTYALTVVFYPQFHFPGSGTDGTSAADGEQ